MPKDKKPKSAMRNIEDFLNPIRAIIRDYQDNKPAPEYLNTRQITDKEDKAEIQKGLNEAYEQRRASEISKSHMDMDKKLNEKR